MTGVFDVAQALDGGTTDQERVWAFVRGFAAAWHEPLTEGDGMPAAELAWAEATLGCSLPAVLREFYVEGAGFEASVEGADEAVAELAQGGVVADVAGALFVVGAACAGAHQTPGEGTRAFGGHLTWPGRTIECGWRGSGFCRMITP